MKNTPETNDANRVAEEIDRGKMARENIMSILENKYFVSALYYSDHFFETVQRSSQKLNLHHQILIGLKRDVITNEVREEYVRELTKFSLEKEVDENSKKLVSPLDYYRAKGDLRSHPDAVDLFTKEGSTVYSMSSGVVVLAERDWLPKNSSTTVSSSGGNEVIIFESHTKRFYRYCHLASVTVNVRDVVKPGQAIGTVGHTGSASRRGHGEHLHLEINQYDRHVIHYFSQKKLLEILKSIRK